MTRRSVNIAGIILLVAVLFLFSEFPALAGGKININRATVDELDRLKGVGKKTAIKIIEFREKNGYFKRPEDITLVNGIGQKLFERNRHIITVNDDTKEGSEDDIPMARPVFLK